MKNHSMTSPQQQRPTITRRRILGASVAGAGAAILAACGGTADVSPTAVPATTGGARVSITTPTAAAPMSAAPTTGATTSGTAPMSAPAATGGSTAATAPTVTAAPAVSPAVTMTRPELKGKVTIGRQPASPLSNGKDDPGNLVFQQLLDRYQKEHPGVSMEWIRVPGSSFDELTQWVRTREASKTVPTITGHHDDTTTSQEATNTSPWVPFTPYLSQNSAYTQKPWQQDFSPDALAFNQGSRKQLYGLPLTTYKASWLYNKKLWNKAGLTEADEPKTWTDFFKVLDKLKASGVIPIARTGDAFALSHTYWVILASIGRQAWFAMNDNKIFASDETKFRALCSGQWKMDTPWNRKAAEVTKRLFQYWPPGSTSLKASDIEQLFLSQKAVLWQGTPGNQGQTILRRIDEAKAEGLEAFDVGAFPTPQPDADVFGADIAKNAAPIADDGETGLAYYISIPSIRVDKDPAAEAIAVDFLQWMTTPAIQAIYVKPSYDLPVNPNVKLEDPRLELFNKNRTQLYNQTVFFYGNRPDWIPNFQAYLLGQKDLDTYIKDEQAEITMYAQNTIRQANLNIPCG